MKLTTQQGTLKIGRDSFPISSIKEASECWDAARETYQWPSSKAPKCEGILDGLRFTISYNGLAWNKTTGAAINIP